MQYVGVPLQLPMPKWRLTVGHEFSTTKTVRVHFATSALTAHNDDPSHGKRPTLHAALIAGPPQSLLRAWWQYWSVMNAFVAPFGRDVLPWQHLHHHCRPSPPTDGIHSSPIISSSTPTTRTSSDMSSSTADAQRLACSAARDISKSTHLAKSQLFATSSSSQLDASRSQNYKLPSPQTTSSALPTHLVTFCHQNLRQRVESLPKF